LDSQSSWAICAFLRKLADAGQAVLCTIHQPSAILFQEFDRLLFLAKGGKTVYFGPIGKNSRTLLDYYESHGARKCGDDENPAEYMLEIVNKGSQGHGADWHEVWKGSEEVEAVQRELDRIHEEKLKEQTNDEEEEAGSHNEFAMPFGSQLSIVMQRVFQQYWRMPEYILAKWMLGVVSKSRLIPKLCEECFLTILCRWPVHWLQLLQFRQQYTRSSKCPFLRLHDHSHLLFVGPTG
jgi:ATP-binding cassette subfamily G (WHITE) protein 2 (PDR)